MGQITVRQRQSVKLNPQPIMFTTIKLGHRQVLQSKWCLHIDQSIQAPASMILVTDTIDDDENLKYRLQ